MPKYKADMHIHSCYSYDSRIRLEEIGTILDEKDVEFAGLADHIELAHDQLKEIMHNLKIRNREINAIQNDTNVEFLKGIEVSEPHLHKDDLHRIIEHHSIDYVLGSIHNVLGIPLKKMQYHQYLEDLYLRSILTMVEEADIDAVAHLDYLRKYIQDPVFNTELLTEIFKVIIERELALEINTSGYRRCGEIFPDPSMLELYASLGGKKVVIGSDSHRVSELYSSIDTTLPRLEPYNFELGIIKKRSFKPF